MTSRSGDWRGAESRGDHVGLHGVIGRVRGVPRGHRTLKERADAAVAVVAAGPQQDRPFLLHGPGANERRVDNFGLRGIVSGPDRERRRIAVKWRPGQWS